MLLQRQIDVAAGDVTARKQIEPWWQRIWRVGGPVDLLGLSPEVTQWVSGFRVGLAGLLMMLGAFFYGRIIAAVNLLAMVLIVFVAPWLGGSAWIVILGATALWGGGTFFLRSTDD